MKYRLRTAVGFSLFCGKMKTNRCIFKENCGKYEEKTEREENATADGEDDDLRLGAHRGAYRVILLKKCVNT